MKYAYALVFVIWTFGGTSWAAERGKRVPSRLSAGRDMAWVKTLKFSLKNFPVVDSHFCLALQPTFARWKDMFFFGERPATHLFDQSQFQYTANMVEKMGAKAWDRLASSRFASSAGEEFGRLWHLVLRQLPGDFSNRPRSFDPYLLEAKLCQRFRDALLPTCLSELSKS